MMHDGVDLSKQPREYARHLPGNLKPPIRYGAQVPVYRTLTDPEIYFGFDAVSNCCFGYWVLEAKPRGTPDELAELAELEKTFSVRHDALSAQYTQYRRRAEAKERTIAHTLRGYWDVAKKNEGADKKRVLTACENIYNFKADYDVLVRALDVNIARARMQANTIETEWSLINDALGAFTGEQKKASLQHAQDDAAFLRRCIELMTTSTILLTIRTEFFKAFVPDRYSRRSKKPLSALRETINLDVKDKMLAMSMTELIKTMEVWFGVNVHFFVYVGRACFRRLSRRFLHSSNQEDAEILDLILDIFEQERNTWLVIIRSFINVTMAQNVETSATPNDLSRKNEKN